MFWCKLFCEIEEAESYKEQKITDLNFTWESDLKVFCVSCCESIIHCDALHNSIKVTLWYS